MKTKIPSWVKVLRAAVFGLVIALAGSSPDLATNLLPHANVRAAISSKQLQTAYGELPLSFEANLGQTDERVKFVSHGSGYSLFLTPTEAVLALNPQQEKASEVSLRPRVKPEPPANTSPTVLRMQLLGSNLHPEVTGLEQLRGKVNYFLGNDPKLWHTNIPTYAQVQYKQVYPGVDMVYYGNPRQLEYDFMIAPGTDPNTIKLAILGAENLEVEAQGDLVMHMASGQIKLHKPLVYQEVNGIRQAISGGYVFKDRQLVSFEVGEYDTRKPLIIDPVLAYSTYLGGSGGNVYGIADIGSGIAVDGFGNAYVGGSTISTDFPTQNPLQPNYAGNSDAFVTKLNRKGTAVVYSTYLGGSRPEAGDGIAVDTFGNAYLTGVTYSTDFPTNNPLQQTFGGFNDAFVAKLNPEGTALVYSTYLGGRYGDFGRSIDVDSFGKAYVTGETSSTDFPTKNALQPTKGVEANAFVAKLNSEGSDFVYSTFLGGYANFGRGIKADASGNAYVTGYTETQLFPTKNPLQSNYGGDYDAFVAKLNPEGSDFVYSTYLGGRYSDYGNSIDVDAFGNAYVTGYTLVNQLPDQESLAVE